MHTQTRRGHISKALVVLATFAMGLTALVLVPTAATVSAQVPNLEEDVILAIWPNGGIPSPDGEVRSSQDGTDYGSAPRRMDFDDSSWPVTLMAPDALASASRVGFYASRENVVQDGRGYYFRYEVDIEDVYQITEMDLQFYYDDAAILFINGQEVYRTIRGNIPGAPATDPSIYQTVTNGGAEEYYVQIPGVNGCETQNPCPEITLAPIDPDNLVANPVGDSPNELVEGTNVIMGMVWTRPTSDIGFDVGMTVTRDLNAPFPRPNVVPEIDQNNEKADSINLAIDGTTENNPNSLNFSATGLPPGLSINSSTGVITGTPTAVGNYNVVVTVTDNGEIGTTSIDFDWTITNTPPVIVNPGPQQTPVINGVSLPIAASDPDGGPVTVTVTGLPTGLSYNSSTGIISGSPTVEGPNSVTIEVTDDELETTTISFPWQVAEPPITINNPGTQTKQWGRNNNLQLTATDPAGGAVTLAVTSALPPGLTFNPNNNTITGSGTEIGTYQIVLQGTGPSGSAVISFNWNITNRPPVITVPSPSLGLANFTEFSVVTSATDPDGGPVELSATGFPPGIEFDPISGIFSGVAETGGTYNVVVTATDDEDVSRTGSFSWEVAPEVDHPIQINEVMSSNSQTLLDEDQDSEDWFELVNTSAIPIDMTGWVIADSSNIWTVPALTLAPGEAIVIFASDKDRTSGPNLHTNFKLSKEGDSLLLTQPDGTMIDSVDPLPLAFADVAMGVRADGSFGYLDTPTPGQGTNSIAGSDYVPILRPFTDRIYNQGETVVEQIDGFDPDGGALLYEASLPIGLSIDSATGEITGTASVPGTWPTTIQVTDPDTRQQDQPVNWYIIPTPTAPAGLVLNEYNAVPSAGEFQGTPDPAFTDLIGNGGDWFEFVVVEDGLDLRGWTLEFWDRDSGNDLLGQSAALQFTNDPFLANLPSGTVITVSEDRPDDVSFNPSAGDWHINFQASATETLAAGGQAVKTVAGSYFTFDSQENFNSSRSNQNVIIRDASGANRTPAVGETEAWDTLVGGVGSGEVMNLCINPTTVQVDPLADYRDNGLFSTYGEPNTCHIQNDPLDPDDDETFVQSFAALRAAAVLQSAAVTSNCVAGNGVVRVELTNIDGSAANLDVTVTGLPTRTVAVGANATVETTFAGRPDGLYTVTVQRGGTTIATMSEPVFCDPQVALSTLCKANDGWITIDVTNPTAQLATYGADFDGVLKSKNIAPYSTDFLRITGRADGDYTIDVTRNATVIGTVNATVDCDPRIPAPAGVYPTVTCLAGNGRIDVNVLNGDSAANYELVVGSLASRSRLVAANDWWRSPVTGRPDGPLDVKLYKNGTLIMDDTFTVACDTTPVVVSQPQVRLLNVCRAAGGFVAWQFANPTGHPRSYVIEFEGVDNRSTTADAYGAAVRGVSARPDGDYIARITHNGTEIWSETVTVACD